MHNNMVTIGGQKMGKSLGNAITLEQFFDGSHPLLDQAYTPMTIRFFMLQAHYRSTLDFSNEALQAAEKGLDRLMKAVETLKNYELRITNYESANAKSVNVNNLEERLREAMDDDLNSALAIAALFDWVSIVNKIHDGAMTIPAEDLARLREIFHRWVFDILGLRDEKAAGMAGTAGGTDRLTPVVEMLLGMRAEAKANKDWALSDRIRDGLAAAGIRVKDRKDGAAEWELE
jgi:cysteinyl-tRNA synthetase